MTYLAIIEVELDYDTGNVDIDTQAAVNKAWDLAAQLSKDKRVKQARVTEVY